MQNEYTVSVYTENSVGMLTRITNIFTRRHLNIDSLTVCESEVKGVFRYTIVLKTTGEVIRKVVGQIEKLIEVFKAYYFENKDLVYQELALYKIKTTQVFDQNLEALIRKNNARILTVEKEFVVFEKTGYRDQIQSLLEQLQKYGVVEFTRSGRVAVVKPMCEVNKYLNKFN